MGPVRPNAGSGNITARDRTAVVVSILVLIALVHVFRVAGALCPIVVMLMGGYYAQVKWNLISLSYSISTAHL